MERICKKVYINIKTITKPMELKTALNRLFDKDLDLTSRQQHILIEIIGAHSRHEFNAGFQAAKDIR